MRKALSPRWPFRRPRGGRSDIRGSVALLFAITVLPLVIAISVAVDFSRMSDARANLARAVDSAALSGAAAFRVNSAADYTRAVVSATAAFCDTTSVLPAGFTLVAGGQSCGGTGGPTVSTQIGGYVAGTPGVAASSCSATNTVVAGVNCGFIVTVSAQATMTSFIPGILGASRTISATGIAANPFLNLGNAIKAQINGSARYADNIWVYPLLLDANGNPDFSTNQGAIPGLTPGVYPANASPSGCPSVTSCGALGTAASPNCTSDPTKCGPGGLPSGCNDSPTQFTCGNFTMIASTFYNTSDNPCPPTSPCYVNGTEFIQGVVQNPKASSSVITATTPIGIAYQSVSGGNYGYSSQGSAPNGCVFPGNTIYTTVSQIYSNAANSIAGGSPAFDWPKVTHWFYSSYLVNGYAPSQGEILSELNPLTYYYPGGGTATYNTRIPSVGSDASGSFVPSLLFCVNPASNGNPYDNFMMTTYPTTGQTNLSLFILKQPANSSYVAPAATGYAGQAYTPAGTPGYQYAALSCQGYGANVFTFYWNDMGGNAAYVDDRDYNNGSVSISCSGSSFVTLIQ